MATVLRATILRATILRATVLIAMLQIATKNSGGCYYPEVESSLTTRASCPCRALPACVALANNTPLL
eukprot:8543819-Pyramimonas_sp.AAC.1